jgi:four helix bundle suffix protein
MASPQVLLPPHGGYRKLKSFQVAQLAYDVTVAFCDRYIDRRSRTHDQMVQAARSGVQNIAEGSVASCTSRKTEMKLTSVARASLEELRLDYEDFLRQRGGCLWPREHPALADLRRERPTTLAEFRAWANAASTSAVPIPERAANGALLLIGVACYCLDRQLATLGREFARDGGFSERLYQVRSAQRSRTQ